MGLENGDLVIEEGQSLYDAKVLQKLDLSDASVRFSPPLSIQNPGQNLRLRPLHSDDYDRGYLQLLRQLTSVGDISREQFLKRFHSMKACKDCYFITVLEDELSGQVIGSATLTIELKFIRECSRRGRLEDIVVDDKYRGKQLGKYLVAIVKLLAKETGCYKLSLDCKDQMINFYKSVGFKQEEGNANFLSLRF